MIKRASNLPTIVLKTAALLCLSLWLAGCMQPKFGGLPCDVTLDAHTSQPVDAYLIPYKDYKADPSILTDDAKMKDYYRGKTPVFAKGIDPYRFVFVVRENGVLSPPEIFNANDFVNGTIFAYKPE